LGNLRTSAAESYDRDPHGAKNALALWTQETLSILPTHVAASQNINREPTTVNRDIAIGWGRPGYQHQPTIRSELRINAPCGSVGRTFQKQGMNFAHSLRSTKLARGIPA